MTLNGADLMVFVNKDGTLKSIAYATSHQMNVTMNTKDTSTKDNGNGMWSNFEAGLMGWTLQSDNLMSDSAENGLSMNDLFEIMLLREPVDVAFALQVDLEDYKDKLDQVFEAPKGGWTPDPNNYYHGKVLVTALNITAPNGEKATASVTLTGCGNLQKVGNGIQKKAVAASLSKPVAPATTTTVETAVKKV